MEHKSLLFMLQHYSMFFNNICNRQKLIAVNLGYGLLYYHMNKILIVCEILKLFGIEKINNF